MDPINQTEIMDDLESFFRCLHLREFFIEEEEEDDADNLFHSPSIWMPQKGRGTPTE